MEWTIIRENEKNNFFNILKNIIDESWKEDEEGFGKTKISSSDILTELGKLTIDDYQDILEMLGYIPDNNADKKKNALALKWETKYDKIREEFNSHDDLSKLESYKALAPKKI